MGVGITVNYSKGCKVRSLRRDLFDEALHTASEADVVVLVLGGSSAPDSETGFLENGAARTNEVSTDSEFDKESGEGYDRAKLRFAGLQLELLRELRKLGKRVITVLIMGRPLIVDEVIDQSDAVLLAWYPGMEGGRAVAEAIFGEVNPAGRLPVSIPKDEAQLPVFYNTPTPRRDYIDLSGTPAFSFGYGLSYTRFEYSKPCVDQTEIRADGKVAVSTTITNTGGRDGDEVAQLYLTTMCSSVARPQFELKAFSRIHLKAGESKKVTFALGTEELGCFNEAIQFVVEPGLYKVSIGGSLSTLTETEFRVL